MHETRFQMRVHLRPQGCQNATQEAAEGGSSIGDYWPVSKEGEEPQRVRSAHAAGGHLLDFQRVD